jgi:hypothetical protein
MHLGTVICQGGHRQQQHSYCHPCEAGNLHRNPAETRHSRKQQRPDSSPAAVTTHSSGVSRIARYFAIFFFFFFFVMGCFLLV